jgi:hypothetical protein
LDSLASNIDIFYFIYDASTKFHAGRAQDIDGSYVKQGQMTKNNQEKSLVCEIKSLAPSRMVNLQVPTVLDAL